jgi:D-alanyl-D-alanine carboxypeptidase
MFEIAGGDDGRLVARASTQPENRAMRSATISSVTALLAAAVLATTACSDAVEEPTGVPSSYTPPTRAEILQGALEAGLRAVHGVGTSAAVITDDGEMWTGAAGISHPGTPVTPDMLFDMGSAGKNLFASLTLKLVEEGALSLEDPIGKYLDIPWANVDENITIRQCLDHTSGLYMLIEHPMFGGPYESIDFDRWWTVDEIFTTLSDTPYFPPGGGWHYTQAGYILGTLIVEEVAGSTTPAEIQRRLLDPLGIDGMLLDLGEPIPSRFEIAHNWVDTNGDGERKDVSHHSREWIRSVSRILYYTRAGDFATWMHALFTGDVLRPESLQEMLRFHSPTPGKEIIDGYGLGAGRKFVDGVELWGHTGSIPGYAFVAYHSPQHQFTVVVMMNYDPDPRYEEYPGEISLRLLAAATRL